ncbi:hypothetical protein MRX96_041973 [Rhipicephalus microplus]
MDRDGGHSIQYGTSARSAPLRSRTDVASSSVRESPATHCYAPHTTLDCLSDGAETGVATSYRKNNAYGNTIYEVRLVAVGITYLLLTYLVITYLVTVGITYRCDVKTPADK